MLEALGKLKEEILDILLPKFCLGCGKEGLYICKDCEVFLSEVDSDLFGFVNPTHMLGLRNQTSVMSVWEYEGLMEKLIYKIKFDGCYHIIDELVEKALAKINLKLPEDTVITFVPMSKKRERQRGFNQSELIARRLGNVLGLAEHKLLEKVRDNRSQVGLGPREREENVRNAFRVKSQIINSKPDVPINILLVDDVYTTGATMNECKKVLRKAGVKNVWGFTLARKLNL